MEAAYSVDIKQDKEQVHILFAGELIINHITKIQKEISEVIDFNHNLSINITNPSSIDVTFIQLICSLKKTCENKGYNVEIESTLNEDIYSLVNNSGFNNLFSI